MAQESKPPWRKRWWARAGGAIVLAVVMAWVVGWATPWNPLVHVGSWISIALNQFQGDVTVPAWIFVSSVAVSVVVIVLLLAFGVFVTWWHFHPEDDRSDGKRYTTDVFLGLVWGFKRFTNGAFDEAVSYCPDCEGELCIAEERRSGPYPDSGMEAVLRCSCCGERLFRKWNNTQRLIGFVESESQRRLRTGEWKQAGERVAKFRAEHGGTGGGA